MECINIARDNKFIKAINDINQEAKNVFGDTYILCPSGMILCDSNAIGRPTVGRHIGSTEFKFFNISDLPNLLVHGKNIYRVFKNIKKHISGFVIDESANINMVLNDMKPEDLIITEKKLPVRMTTDVASLYSNTIDIDEIIKLYKKAFGSSDNVISLTPESVEGLVKNKYFVANDGKHFCRITRELIPALKKDNDVSIAFDEHTDPSLFTMYIRVKRSTMTTLHVYTCFYM